MTTIYTSYFGKIRAIQKQVLDAHFISIARFNPDGFEDCYGCTLEDFAPLPDILKQYKQGEIDQFGFTTLYRNQLDKISKESLNRIVQALMILSRTKKIFLLCYEKPGDFCHRHVLADWLEETCGFKVSEYDYKPESV